MVMMNHKKFLKKNKVTTFDLEHTEKTDFKRRAKIKHPIDEQKQKIFFVSFFRFVLTQVKKSMKCE